MTSQHVTQQDRTVATLVHLSIFLNFLFFLSGIIAALVVALLYRERSSFVARHALQSLAFQIALAVVGLLVIAFVVALWVGTFLALVPWSLMEPSVPPGTPRIAPLAGLFLWAVTVGCTVLAVVLLALAIVLPIVGAMRASRGEDFDYPLIGRIVPAWWYQPGL